MTQELSHLNTIRANIARWTEEGAPRELIEERIDQLPRSDEQKSELWLWAWSCRNPPAEPRRRSVIGD